jgi:hypothetical protein
MAAVLSACATAPGPDTVPTIPSVIGSVKDALRQVDFRERFKQRAPCDLKALSVRITSISVTVHLETTAIKDQATGVTIGAIPIGAATLTFPFNWGRVETSTDILELVFDGKEFKDRKADPPGPGDRTLASAVDTALAGLIDSASAPPCLNTTKLSLSQAFGVTRTRDGGASLMVPGFGVQAKDARSQGYIHSLTLDLELEGALTAR